MVLVDIGVGFIPTCGSWCGLSCFHLYCVYCFTIFSKNGAFNVKLN